MTEVEILDGRTPRELLFDGSGAWQYTKTEVYGHEVPEAVTAALAASEYAAYFIDDIDHYRTPDGEFYRYDLESVLGDVKVDIAPDGTLTVVQPGSGKPGQGNDRWSRGGLPLHRDEVSGSTHGRVRLRRRFAGGGDLAREPREKVCFNGRNAWVRTEWISAVMNFRRRS